MNQIVIKGRLTRDPEVRYTQSGKMVCNFDVAVNRRFDNETADFFRCQAWSKTGEFVQKYFVKGQEILLSGEMQSNAVDKDGEKRIYWSVNVQIVDFCGSKASRDEHLNDRYRERVLSNPHAPAPDGFVPVDSSLDEEDLPF